MNKKRSKIASLFLKFAEWMSNLTKYVSSYNWGMKCFIWLFLLLILTLSNVEQDFFESLASSALIGSGVLFIFYGNFYALTWIHTTTKKWVRAYIYLPISITVVFILSQVFIDINDWLLSILKENTNDSNDLLNIMLPGENKDFFQTNEEEAPRAMWRITNEFKVIILFCGGYFSSIYIYFLKRNENQKQQQRELERQKTEMELKFLRSQINPHFLFNALNNIYSMTYMGDKNAPQAVLSLSEMLRYLVDNCKGDLIMLKDEINYVEKYVEFQRYCLREGVNLKFYTDIKNSSLMIPPMLLQPFVENCFKYSGIASKKDAYVDISLVCNDTTLLFTTKNSKNSTIKLQNSQSKREGVGIKNVITRLNLTYPKRHTISIKDGETEYEVKLEINLVDKNLVA